MRVRRFVDWDIANRTRPLTPMLGWFALAFCALFLIGVDSLASLAVWLIAFAAAVAWTAFTTWRFWRVCKAHSIKGDRRFDHRDKYVLGPEYWTSESLHAAHRRRRQRNAG